MMIEQAIIYAQHVLPPKFIMLRTDSYMLVPRQRVAYMVCMPTAVKKESSLRHESKGFVALGCRPVIPNSNNAKGYPRQDSRSMYTPKDSSSVNLRGKAVGCAYSPSDVSRKLQTR